jgi:hypothetical protein
LSGSAGQNVSVYLGGDWGGGQTFYTDGVVSVNMVAGNVNSRIDFEGWGDFAGTIDDVSVKLVL